jgi:hypothetical protein
MGTDDPSKLGLAEKTNIWQAGLQSFCFTLPQSRSECTLAHFFVSVFIRVISGFLLFFPVAQCDLLVRSFRRIVVQAFRLSAKPPWSVRLGFMNCGPPPKANPPRFRLATEFSRGRP